MGIKSLHKGLTFCTKKSNIHEFSGQILAVDSSSWLHKSVYSVSETYVESTERNYVDPSCVRVAANYISSRCRELLIHFRVKSIILVMDGKRCPMKSDTNDEREQRRQQNLSDARSYKRSGQRDKAQDKYKTCIKIRDDFTKAVMDEVAKSFSADHRVGFVWSPYEADAQLARLCIDRRADAVITEDSDVLVYSAASHTPFPVIFKLDRSDGSCDVIRMDWLLADRQGTPNGKSGNTLEVILRSLALRQAQKPGFGVRLFVQACVLAGCDYAPNKLSGIGLVNAFKLVRDNAYRDDETRISKVLDSIPRKAKMGLDIAEYAQILTKSEAVFYYHIVEHSDGAVKPMLEPRLSSVDVEQPNIFNHFPDLGKFEDTTSFLGDTGSTCSSIVPGQSKPPPVPEIIIPVNTKPKRKCIETVKRVQNPYLQSNSSNKRPRQDSRPPFHEVTKNNRGIEAHVSANPFAKFARKTTEQDAKLPPLQTCQQTDQDVRFVKRMFPSESDHSYRQKIRRPIGVFGRVGVSSQLSTSADTFQSQHNSSQSTNYSNNGPEMDNTNDVAGTDGIFPIDNSFDYQTVQEDIIETSNDRFSLDESEHDGIDLTAPALKRASTPLQFKSKQDTELACDGLSYQLQPRRYFGPPEGDGASQHTSDHFSARTQPEGTFSKYFSKVEARRVTLDPSDQPTSFKAPQHSPEPSSPIGRNNASVLSESNVGYHPVATYTPGKDWSGDEGVDSPESTEESLEKRISYRSNIPLLKRQGSAGKSPAARNPYASRQSGPLQNAFRRQMESSFSDNHSRPKISPIRSPFTQRTKHGTKPLRSYFQPVKIHVDQSDDDFLWNIT